MTQPVGIKAVLDQTVQFFVSAAGYRLRYQWAHNGVEILGATNAVLSLPDVQPADAGDYSVVIISGAARAASDQATLMVYPEGTIVQPPVGADLFVGDSLWFSVAASGAHLGYQWLYEGRPIPGATGSMLWLQNVQISDSGDYTIILVQNTAKEATNATAKLTVHTYAEALNCPAMKIVSKYGYSVDWDLNYYQIGPAWSFQTNTTHDGVGALQRRVIPSEFGHNSNKAILQTTVTGPGRFSFWSTGAQSARVIVDPENRWFNVIYPETQVKQEPGSIWWQTICEIPSGRHVVGLEVWADAEYDFYLDEVSFVSTAPSFSVPDTHYSAENGFQGFLNLSSTNEIFFVERSEDLVKWTRWLAVSNCPNHFFIHDPNATNRARTFYRTVK